MGSPYRMSFVNYVGLATGGESFNPNPSVAITDRGGNKISDINSGYISAYLHENPTGNELLLPESQKVAYILGGLAIFQGLYINEAGYPYVVGFHLVNSVSSFLCLICDFVACF